MSWQTEKRRKVEFINKEPSLTKTSFQDECDVNKIVERAIKTGILPNAAVNEQPQYCEFNQSIEWADAFNLVAQANAQFNSLDARVRAQFGNNAAAFMSFTQDPKNLDKLVEWGLAERKTERVDQGTPEPKKDEPKPVSEEPVK